MLLFTPCNLQNFPPQIMVGMLCQLENGLTWIMAEIIATRWIMLTLIKKPYHTLHVQVRKEKKQKKKAALLLLQDENLMTRIFLQDRDISRQFNNNGLLIFQTNISPNSKLLLLLLLLHEKLHSAAFDRQWPPAKLTPTFFWCLAASPVHDLYCSLYWCIQN